ncbi:FAD-binding oxidoreductase [Solirubrobacter sp. CPCC 204708]|uniref:FAD-binding oxidoreductase n=1 Tax=Solirubrobacter deserti TaxID=2282478 RepID=A0ABT4RJ75_9ACTN|nr:FAD-binding oxidoreductase [Solirubrobacter deserti]MBE2317636.1 FAD-binding oxidoreductase [Solirubrobacter deserti]MDA0138586.1 FAD-binding oxidoreductase [Solirubrobacter deserti]
MARPRAPLPSGADVVVVGGGVVGASAAFHLAEAGAEVVLLERDQLAGGSTSKAAGGLRAQFSDALNIQIAKRSLEACKAFGERPGWEIDFEEIGYLFVLTTEAEVEAFGRSVALQNELGVPSRIVGPEEALELCPLLTGQDILAASYCPTDAHATPEAVVQGYAFGAREHGAHLAVATPVEGIDVVDGTITGVRTPHGNVTTGTVICAAGAWSRACGALAGVHLDVTPLRRQVLFTAPLPDLPAKLPLTIDFASGFYFHREGRGLLMGMGDPDELPGFSTERTDDWIPALLEVAERRVPAIVSAPIQGGWAGLYDMSPDHNAMIGEAEDVSRFLYATGFSGHGFLQGPATGEILRDLVLGREPFVDVAPLSAKRFERGELAPELHIV